MTIHTVDTVIIGGGPAGICCAIGLQKRGITTLVIEKKSFPREKTCGGMVTGKTVDRLVELLDLSDDGDLESVFCDQSKVVALFSGTDCLTESTVSKPFRFVKRTIFDSFLVEQYRKKGGNMLENTCCKRIDLQQHKLSLSNGDSVAFCHLVGADGALSETRKLLGYRAPKLGFCVETHIPKKQLPDCRETRIAFGAVPKGYAWIFPSGDDFCVGLGGVYQKKIPYNRLLDQFLSSLGVHPQTCRKKGAFVPYGKPVNQAHGSGDVILIGDAGGFVDPIYGEGLYFAVASGMEAANAISESSENIRFVFCKRTEALRKTIVQGNRLQKFFFKPTVQKLFRKIVRGKNGFVGFYCDNQIAQYNYSYARLWKLYRDYKRLHH
ncbi:MAG: geranylgeranyl reductase family protein [Ruminococcaceae bacterium]|nr:geranylgeranyl reductase family protein [Oscillospiraceae bacterium]